MDWWMDGVGGEEERGRGKRVRFVFLNCLNSQLNVSMMDQTESHSLDPLAISPSAIHLSLDGLIDLIG